MAVLRSDPAEVVKPAGDLDDETSFWRSPAVRITLLVLLIAATGLAGVFLNAWMDPVAELRGWLSRAGSAAPPLFIVLFLALNTVGIPLPLLGAAAGVAFGPVTGATTALVAMTITACAQFLLARHIAGERVRQRFGHALLRVNQLLERRGVVAVAGARFVPGPFSEFNMLAGLTSLRLGDFLLGTALGCVPKAVAWSGIGALLFSLLLFLSVQPLAKPCHIQGLWFVIMV